jgi:hypothetical protein
VFGSLSPAALGVSCLGEMTGLVLQELAEFFPLAGGVGAEPVQLSGGVGAQLVEFAGGVLPDAGGFGGGGFGAGLGDSGPLCGLLGFLASFPCFVQRGIACGFSGLDGSVAFDLGGGDGLLGLPADELDLGGVHGGSFREPVVGLAGPFLLEGQPRAHVFGRVVGVGAHLVGDGGAALGFGSSCLGGCGALLGCGPGGFDFGFGL